MIHRLLLLKLIRPSNAMASMYQLFCKITTVTDLCVFYKEKEKQLISRGSSRWKNRKRCTIGMPLIIKETYQ